METVKWLNAKLILVYSGTVLVSVNAKEKAASKFAPAAIAERFYAKLVVVYRDVWVVIVA